MADKNDTPAPAPAPAPAEFKVAEKRADGTVILQMDDGRMFPARLRDGADAPHKGSTVSIRGGEVDKEGVPLDAEIA